MEGQMAIQPLCSTPQAFGTRAELQVSMLDGSINTYSVAGVNLSAFAGALLQMAGNSSNIVRITHIDISMTALAASQTTVSLQRFSTTAFGGSNTPFSVAKHDINNPAAVSQPLNFTSAPTLGTPVGGPIRSAALAIAAGGSVPAVVQSWDFGFGPKQGLILRSADFICLLVGTLGGTTNADVSVEWTESPT
jgi:hypothetical protein